MTFSYFVIPFISALTIRYIYTKSLICFWNVLAWYTGIGIVPADFFIFSTHSPIIYTEKIQQTQPLKTDFFKIHKKISVQFDKSEFFQWCCRTKEDSETALLNIVKPDEVCTNSGWCSIKKLITYSQGFIIQSRE